MPLLALDLPADPAIWTTRAPDAGPSTRLAVVSVAAPRWATAAIGITFADAIGHRAEAAIAPRDLTGFDDLQLWVHCDRSLGTTPGFALALTLQAPDLGFDDPANRWIRRLPITASHRWDLVVVGLSDLPDQIRRRCNGLRAEVVSPLDATVALAGAAAFRREPVTDTEVALLALLDRQLDLGGRKVPAVVAPDQPDAVAQPHLRIRPIAVRAVPDLARHDEVRTDYTEQGFTTRPAPEPIELDYAVDLVATTRADQRAMIDFVVRALPAAGTMLVAGRPTPLTWWGPLAPAGEPPVPSAAIRVTTTRSAPGPAHHQIRPHRAVEVAVDHG